MKRLLLLVTVALAAIMTGCNDGSTALDSQRLPSPTPAIPFALRKPAYLPSGVTLIPDVQYVPGANGKAGLAVLVYRGQTSIGGTFALRLQEQPGITGFSLNPEVQIVSLAGQSIQFLQRSCTNSLQEFNAEWTQAGLAISAEIWWQGVDCGDNAALEKVTNEALAILESMVR